MHARFIAHGEFGGDACHGSVCIYAIARLEALHIGAYRLDEARGVCAGRIGQFWFSCIGPGPDVGIDRIYTGGLHADKDLSGIGLWIRRLFKPHHLGPAKFTDTDRLHCSSLSKSRANDYTYRGSGRTSAEY